MSDSDSFIEEVTEEVRRDQLYKYVRRYGWIAVVLVVGAVGVTGFLEWQKASLAADAQARGDQFAAALDADDPAARAEALAALTANSGPAAVIVELRRAAELAEAGDVDGAVAAYDGVANSAAGPVYTELARLKSVILQGTAMDAAARQAELESLAAPGAIYRPLALEQQAISALAADDKDTAIALYAELVQDSESTDALRNRASQVLVALDAEIPAMSQLLSE
ncbi:tetratricopeptide repeat protein [Neptunicoccus sediminis]|uniref:tetratricopeptide repeat protein n=1 Tax=Neptunicoccus sediminis TaxID=1892596 RepID=UPI000845C9B1|nr:tetratricopeptide repeat protein [Neptunicoccus sediminis]